MSKNLTNPDRNSNRVMVTGKVADINFRTGKNKNGQDYISYIMHVRVNQAVFGQLETSDIEVGGYASKYNKKNELNPFYTTIDNLHTLKTIENVGIDDADVIQLNSARLQDNSYVSKTSKQLVKSFRVDNSAFFNKVNASSPEGADFVGDVYVLGMDDEFDAAGDSTGRLLVRGAVARYGGEIDVFTFVAEEPSLVSKLQDGWQIHDTVPLKAHIRIAKKEVAKPVAEDSDSWGEDFSVGASTVTVKELVIVGARSAYPEEASYDNDDMRKAYNSYKARNEQMMAEASGTTKKATRSATASWDE